MPFFITLVHLLLSTLWRRVEFVRKLFLFLFSAVIGGVTTNFVQFVVLLYIGKTDLNQRLSNSQCTNTKSNELLLTVFSDLLLLLLLLLQISTIVLMSPVSTEELVSTP